MTGDRTVGLTPADVTEQLDRLGDDNPAERLDYNLSHAIDNWSQATHNNNRDAAGQLRWATETGSLSITLTALQEARLTHLLNVDTGLHLAHSAATRKD